ncbi:MAG: OmpA family protein [Lentimicrobiaceae bacterium]|jgi:outer membrane protein OmpA-like peptidoglycan-associated protein
MKKTTLFIIGLLIFGATNLQAQDANNPWIIGLGTNFVHSPDNKKQLFKTNEWNVGPFISKINLGKYIAKGFSIESAASLNEITKNAGLDVAGLSYVALDVNFKYDLNNIFGQTGFFDPYLLLGGGYNWVDSKGTGTLNSGAGFNIWFNEKLGLNFQTVGKHVFVDFPLHNNHWQHSIGLVFKFGGKDTDGDGIYDKDDACPNITGLVALKGCPDTDGDGIADKDDTCPNLAGLVALKGCPDTDGDGIADKDDACPNLAGLAALKGCPDTDGDGIADKDDACPQIAGIAANKGCPWPDTDGDGVLDKDDKCPTEVGTVSNNGCPETISAVVEKQIGDFAETILFDFGKSRISDDANAKLVGIVSVMKQYSAVKFSIKGFTDNIGSTSYNQKLSEDRANAVRNYFVTNGIDAANLTSKGYGETRPIDTNATSQGRANNRRVDIEIVK